MPDISFPTPIDASEFGEIVADNTLPWDSVPKAPYTPTGEISPASFNELNLKHLQRIANEQEFVFIAQDIEKYKADKDKKTISLVETTRKAERDKRDNLSLIRANLRRKTQNLEPVKSLDDLPKKRPEIDPYLDEAAFVTLDFIELGKLAKN